MRQDGPWVDDFQPSDRDVRIGYIIISGFTYNPLQFFKVPFYFLESFFSVFLKSSFSP